MVNNLQNHQRWHDHIRNQAMIGEAVFEGGDMKPLPKISGSDSSTGPASEGPHTPPAPVATVVGVAAAAAREASESGDFAAC